MASKKNKKKQQTGGLQPKGGAYANQDAALASKGGIAESSVDPAVAQALLKKEKIKAGKEKKAKAKEKAKSEKKEKKGIIKGLKETGAELKKVRWPSFGKTLKQTGVVLSVVVIFSLVVFGLDRALGALYDLLTKGY